MFTASSLLRSKADASLLQWIRPNWFVFRKALRRDKERKKGPIDFLVYSKGTQEVSSCGEVDGKSPGRREHRAHGEETQVLCWMWDWGLKFLFHLSATVHVKVAKESDWAIPNTPGTCSKMCQQYMWPCCWQTFWVGKCHRAEQKAANLDL